MNLYTLGYIMLLAAFGLSLYAQTSTARTYGKYFQVSNAQGISGYEVARAMLDYHGLQDVKIVEIQGTLTDHYDPTKRIMCLSTGVYRGKTISSMGVAAHETGHAIQHAEHFGLMRLRTAIAPLAILSSKIMLFVLIGGFVLQMTRWIRVSVILLFILFLFQLVTLPVEFDASRRAMEELEGQGMVTSSELSAVQEVLHAAWLTYLAATLGSLAQVIRFAGISRDSK